VYNAAAKPCNMALGKAAYQISVKFEGDRPYPALLAVDGSRMASLEAGSCSVTGLAVDPWWSVDIRYRRTVVLVAITTRKQSILTRLIIVPNVY